ncbi:MAG: STAS domain-containing protein, partial [Akkermansiaceae bacterium]|nr:STAS domain-containing protein [Akkermansiaceae bacterium]
REAEPGKTRVVIDMAEVEYMDSAALGMLLLLRECHGGEEARIRIINCKEGPKKILAISNFHRLFDID